MVLGFVLLVLIVAFAIVLSEREAPQQSLGQPSARFIRILKEIQSLKGADSPQFEHLRDLSRLLALHSNRITSVQQEQTGTTLPLALVGKQVSWELKLDDVTRTASWFARGVDQAGSFWLRHKEHSPPLTIECQVWNKEIQYLTRGQSVQVSGRIAEAVVLFPSVIVVVADAVVSPRRVDKSVRPETVDQVAPKPGLPQQPISSNSRTRPSYKDPAHSTRAPSYQTGPLIGYSRDLQVRAQELFEIVRQQIGQRAVRYKGSFSISATSSSETVAKIAIYQRGIGRVNGEWPALADGIYILVRRNGGAGRAIWKGNLLRSSTYEDRLDPERTIGIAPKHQERFAYFRLESEDDLQAVAGLLVLCASA